MKYILFLSSIIIFCYAGKKIAKQKQSKEIFPNQVGDFWMYDFDGGSNSKKPNRIYVNVAGLKKLPDGRIAKIWIYKYPDGTDTNYVVSDEKAVQIYHLYNSSADFNATELPFEKWKFLFPFISGKSWPSDEDYGDTIRIISSDILTVPAGKFPNTYLLINVKNKSVAIGNYRKTDSIWLTPNIGVTKYVQREFQMRPAQGNGSWELVKFQLK